jgi:V/A-type H+-transporting ATPase subunit E
MSSLSKIADKVSEEIKVRISQELSKAKEEAFKIVERKHQEVLANYQPKIKEVVAKGMERVEGERARLEVEVKRAVNLEKEAWLNRVKEEVYARLEAYLDSMDYRNSLQKILFREAVESCEIVCRPEDEKLVIQVLGSLGVRCLVKVNPALRGGVYIYYPDKGMSKDYTLDLAISQVFDNYKEEIASILFGE